MASSSSLCPRILSALRRFATLTFGESAPLPAVENARVLLVGLNNPGSAYAGTRHNVGEDALRAAALRHGFGAWAHHGNAQISTGRVGDVGVVAALPTTYMNRSGAAVAALARYYGLTAEQVVLLHDDLDLAVGRLKVKRGGSDGGHRGIRSTAASLRTDSFWRLRIGIGRPPVGVPVPAFVLQRFLDGEREAVDAACSAVAEHLGVLLGGGGDEATTGAAASSFLNKVAAGGGR